MNEVYHDTDISNRRSEQVVQFETDHVHLNTITIDGCKCIGKIVTKGTKITHLHLLVPLGKPHMAPKEDRMV